MSQFKASYIVISDGDGNCYTVLDAAEQLAHSEEAGTPEDFWMRANSYNCPRGYAYGSAWILMQRKDVDAMEAADDSLLDLRWFYHDDDLEVEFPQPRPQPGDTQEGLALQVQKLQFIHAESAQHIYDSQENATYLVEFRDVRHMFQRLTCGPLRYNVYASGTCTYDSASLNMGTPHTWQEIIDDLWSNLPFDHRGTTPTLPYTPAGTPNNYDFVGLSPWRAIHDLLCDIGCVTSFDPTEAEDPFTIVRYGELQEDFADQKEELATELNFDFDPVRAKAAVIPETVVVIFDDPTATSEFESVSNATDDDNAIEGTETCLLANMANCVAADVADVAAERTENYVNKTLISDALDKKWYRGVQTDIPIGSEVSNILWRIFGNGQGTITEVSTGPDGYKRSPPKPRSSGGEMLWLIWVHIDVALPRSREAICSPMSVPAGKAFEDIPLLGRHGAPEGTILVCDPMGCYFDEPDYVDREGWATYQDPLYSNFCQSGTGTGSGSGTGSGGSGPIWMCVGLCCPLPECD
jgi:hypothetical protein